MKPYRQFIAEISTTLARSYVHKAGLERANASDDLADAEDRLGYAGQTRTTELKAKATDAVNTIAKRSAGIARGLNKSVTPYPGMKMNDKRAPFPSGKKLQHEEVIAEISLKTVNSYTDAAEKHLDPLEHEAQSGEYDEKEGKEFYGNNFRQQYKNRSVGLTRAQDRIDAARDGKPLNRVKPAEAKAIRKAADKAFTKLKPKNEEVEPIDEISGKLAKSYIDNVNAPGEGERPDDYAVGISAVDAIRPEDDEHRADLRKEKEHYQKMYDKRTQGLNRAHARVQKAKKGA